MAKQITDEEDKLKRQARRRLIGAVALTTTIIVVLPMVLDSEPKQVGQDIDLRIPDKDKVAAFAPRIDVQAASAPVTTLPASQVVAVSAPVIVNPSVSQVVAVPAPVAVPVAAPVVAVVPDLKPVSSPAKSAVIAPERKPDQVKHDAKSEHAKHEVKQDHAKSAGVAHTEQGQPAPQSGFIVQIGAFANADTAHSWQKNLNSQGFKAYTEKVGNKTRVRIGPYSTREAANNARHKLETKGLHSNIVELE
jgi:DedD protein